MVGCALPIAAVVRVCCLQLCGSDVDGCDGDSRSGVVIGCGGGVSGPEHARVGAWCDALITETVQRAALGSCGCNEYTDCGFPVFLCAWMGALVTVVSWCVWTDGTWFGNNARPHR